MKKMSVATAVVIGAGLALAGCNRSAPEQPADTDNAAVPETNVTTTASNVAAPVIKAPTVTANASEAIARPEPAAPDAQTQDDADATGMTSRVHRDDVPANETTAPQ